MLLISIDVNPMWGIYLIVPPEANAQPGVVATNDDRPFHERRGGKAFFLPVRMVSPASSVHGGPRGSALTASSKSNGLDPKYDKHL
jgi:hypothetical protein